MLIAVIIAGIATMATVGNYTYFGTAPAELDFGVGWVAVLVCGVCGGLAGGAFSSLLLLFARGLPGKAGQWVQRYPVLFAAFCGLLIAIFGWLGEGSTYGTGYAQARSLVAGHSDLPESFFLLKFCASVVSYVSGIPGGIFAPSLAVGAGLGHAIAQVLIQAPAGTIVLLGMVSYFSGVVAGADHRHRHRHGDDGRSARHGAADGDRRTRLRRIPPGLPAAALRDPGASLPRAAKAHGRRSNLSQVLLQAGHQLDQVARPEAAVQLPEQDVVPPIP